MVDILIDHQDAPLLSLHKFHYVKTGYHVAHVYIDGKRTTRKLHQIIMGDAPEGMVVDHINRNRADNRRANLRFVTWAENAQNRSVQKRTFSGLRGAHVNHRTGKFRATCRDTHLGTYLTAEEAAAVARAARIVALPGAHD